MRAFQRHLGCYNWVAMHAGIAQMLPRAVGMAPLIALYWGIPCSDFGRLDVVRKVYNRAFWRIFQHGDTCSIGGDMRETVFAGKAPPSLLNIVGTAGHTNKPWMDSYSVSPSLSNEPSYTLIGQRFTTLTSSPGPYLSPSPARSGADITKRFVAACGPCPVVLILR